MYLTKSAQSWNHGDADLELLMRENHNDEYYQDESNCPIDVAAASQRTFC